MLTPSSEMLEEQRRACSAARDRLPATFGRRSAAAPPEGAAQAIAAKEEEPGPGDGAPPLITEVDVETARRALSLLEAPKAAAIETLATWIESGHDLPAVARARGIREETVAASLARCVAHGLVDVDLLRTLAAQCGVADRATAAAVGAALAVEAGDVQLGALLSLARAKGAPPSTTYHHVQIVAALVSRGAVWFGIAE
jgi:hypothetical protein